MEISTTHHARSSWVRGIILLALLSLSPLSAVAAPSQPLLDVYASRTDLRAAFDARSAYRAVPESAAGFLIDIEDWASQYGWREYPSLSSYTPPASYAPPAPHDPTPTVTADSYVVIDRTSGQIIVAQHADREWPIASLTKLMTAQIALDSGTMLSSTYPVKAEDDVGGAKLYVNSGDTFTLDGLLYATLVGSANNAANALTRATGMDKPSFVAEMNKRAASLNLSHTTYVDPTGIETGNISTARELARIADLAFRRSDIRRYTTTASASVRVLNQGTVKTIKNTNWMLWKPEYDDIFVMAGKTGYLDESGWNLAVALRPEIKDEKRELLVVTFGSDSRADSFKDAEALARWAWHGD
jgi:D-alanyl-D-alanine endopeptidase (penicillin-binding protein 7)